MTQRNAVASRSTPSEAITGADLRLALDRNEFQVYYQPLIDLRSGDTVGAEALLRWRHSQLGFLPPTMFIPLAESSGLIGKIGRWVLHEACRQTRAWQLSGFNPITIAVNVSAVQLEPEFLATVQAALAESQLAAQYLELEITESAAFGDPQIYTMLNRLRQMGVEIAVDDFGTGYSSMVHLKCCPFTKLKIDKAFVERLVQDRMDQTIVRVTIALGHGLGMKITAEGVESESSLKWLAEAGCDLAQGYLFAKPMAAEEFTRMRRDVKQPFRCAR